MELRGLGGVREKLKAQGGEIIAISVDPLKRIQEGRTEHPDLPCLLASDESRAAIGILKLVHPAMAKKLAAPANLLVDRQGVLRWAHYASEVSDRPQVEVVLREVGRLNG